MANTQFLINVENIDLIAYDFDGVMTDNRVLVLENGREAVFCNRSDGLAVQEIKKCGIPQVILSTETNRVVKARARKLKIEVIYGVSDKRRVLIDYCKERDYDLKEVVYIGNDVNDLEAMKSIGYPIAPQDANTKVKDIAKIIISKNGGQGVIKEFFENVLTFQKEEG
jgi:YrbI family 3-deoxy-D-manno-octulosonate 8-phosphate phosphatase